MAEPTLKKTHELLEKLADYVMNEVPKKSQVMTKQELEKRFNELKLEIKLDMEKRFQHMESELETKADKGDIQLILESMDGIVKELDSMRTEQSAFISGLRRIENRVEVLEKKVG